MIRAQGRLWLFLILFFGLWTIHATVFFHVEDSITSGFWLYVYSNGMKVLLWIIPTFLYVFLVEKKKPLEYLRLTTPLARGSGWVLGVSVVGIVLFVLLGVWVRGSHFRVELGMWGWLGQLGSVWFSPVAEELLFRGLVLRALMGSMSFGLANVVTSVLFVLIHWPYWLWAGGWSINFLVTSGSIFLLSLVFGYAVYKTNSLWSGVVLHIMNNFWVALWG